jgi:two-component system phosphate regulon response regulator PhoB
LEIDRINHVVRLDGTELQLTPTEFRLLWTIARQPGRPFSRHELMDICRGEDANALERTIDVHIRSLRQKLGDRAEMVETVRGVGYRFRPERAEAATP